MEEHFAAERGHSLIFIVVSFVEYVGDFSILIITNRQRGSN
jgi:hypothetical protein